MKTTNMKKTILDSQLLLAALVVLATLFTASAYAAAPGITSTGNAPGTFNLTAQQSYLTQPDGQSIYSWGYGCASGSAPAFVPAAITTGSCGLMQVPGPTLIVTENQPVSVTLTNSLPTAAGNTSILFPSFNVTAVAASVQPATCTGTPAPQGLLTVEAAPGCAVTYTFTPSSPGTRAYYSGTQSDLQVEMGLYGAIIVLPSAAPSSCDSTNTNLYGKPDWSTNNHVQGAPEKDFRLAHAAYDHPRSCYDREYLFQFSEMDPVIHSTAEKQVLAGATQLVVPTEPYHPSYFMINGRSMPDDMDANYAPQYPHQPYNGNPHMHPGEQVLLRIIGQGRWQHPFHEHGNHVRILGRDGNLILASATAGETNLAGPLLFTTTTTPGLAMDGIFYWTAKGLNWDAYGHTASKTDATIACTPDVNGYNTNTAAQTSINYYEWCQDHDKPLQVAPFGDVGAGGPTTLPDPNLFTNGPWYSGSPYLGPDATQRAVGPTGTTPPSGTIANPPSSEAGFAFMWHSHNEREITTNNIFPGGMLMMLLVDSREFVIDESN